MIRFVFALALLPSVAAADIPRVAGDIAPVRSLVARVMEGVGAPAAILPQGASPHSHSMRPSEARALISADLVVWIGAGLTPFLSDPIETLASDAQILTLLDLPGTVRREVGAGHAHDHGHDHGDDHDHGQDHDRGREREGSGNDPHAWLDPGNAAVWLDAIADRLAALDPDNAATYRANAAAGRTRRDGPARSPSPPRRAWTRRLRRRAANRGHACGRNTGNQIMFT
jgi:zinc transport system substrate-binding protein